MSEFGPIACRDEGCHGGCGLKSIHYYGEAAQGKPAPPDEDARVFAKQKHLNINRTVAANRGVPIEIVLNELADRA